MVEKKSAAQLESDITLLQVSASPVAKALATFLSDVIAVKSAVLIAEQSFPEISMLYKVAYKRASEIGLIAATAKLGLGRIHVKITDDNHYYLVYYPRVDQEGGLRDVYASVKVPDADRYQPDTRMIVLEIDMTATEIAARPLALITDSHEPMSGGLITGQLFVPANLPYYQSLVEEVKQVLAGDFMEVNGEVLPRPRLQKDIPAF